MNRLFGVGALIAVIAATAVWIQTPGASRPSQITQVPTDAALPAVSEDGRHAFATFAGGCFWCVEADFERVPGVIEAISGYTGGSVEEPSYRQVASGDTGHIESVLVRYDPAVVGYDRLLQAFWRMIDPTDPGGQFADRGQQYSTAIFFHDARQQATARESRAGLAASNRFAGEIVTPILPAQVFYTAEEYHQDYAARNPLRYGFYRRNSGRDDFLAKTWGDRPATDFAAQRSHDGGDDFTKPPSDALRERLTPLQYRVTQEDGAEPPFDNVY